MSPVIPHIANECLTKISFGENTVWPLIDKKHLVKNNDHLIIIQVNGKKRNSISIDKSLNENDLIKLIKNKQLIKKYFDDGELFKTIYIKDKLINFIIK